MYKRYSIIVFCFILAVFFSYSDKSDIELVPVMAVPSTNKVIIIDAGHGTPDEGAENDKGISEAKINLQIAIKLQHLLESSGSVVILTRSDENAIYELDAKTISQKKVSDIKNRVKIGNNSSADIFVSIHLNKIPQSQYWGWQTFYNNNENSKKLSECIQSNLNNTISNSNKRIPHLLSNIYLMKYVEIPISIVECGFLSNYEESEKLISDDYQNQISWGIYTGIMDYFKY